MTAEVLADVEVLTAYEKSAIVYTEILKGMM